MIEHNRDSEVQKERALLVGLYGPETQRWQAEEYLEELALLTDTAGGIVVDKVLQNRTQPDPNTYIGKGKLRELKGDVGGQKIDLLIFDDDLSPTQIRNIEKSSDAKVLDRSGLILDIFASRAQTAAAKTQVELAQLQYLLPRLTRFWTHLSRQKGGIGTKGPGETQIETDRRLIGRRIATLKEKLEKLDQQRQTQRKRRSDSIRISLVGYTNAGKSTLMNTLTETDVLAENRLFATLDSTVRKHEIKKQEILFSDTVGFIRKLPHGLIESFKSTLDEVREADILLHVVDASSPMLADYIQVVNDTLADMGIEEKEVIMVFNKIDRISSQQIAEIKRDYPESVLVSAERGIGIDLLEDKVTELIFDNFVYKELMIPVKDYKAVSFIHDVAQIREKKYVGNQVDIRFDIHKKDLIPLEKMLNTNGEQAEMA